MFDSYVFLGLLGITAATLGLVLVQLIFEMSEVKKRKLQERLSSETESHYEPHPYAPIATQEQKQDSFSAALSKVAPIGAFDRKLRQTSPNMPMGRFVVLTLGLAATAFIALFMVTA